MKNLLLIPLSLLISAFAYGQVLSDSINLISVSSGGLVGDSLGGLRVNLNPITQMYPDSIYKHGVSTLIISINNRSIDVTDVKVYPVPAINTINIQNSDDKIRNYSILVYDLTGKLLIQKLNNYKAIVEISITKLPVGSYLLKVMDADNKPYRTVKFSKVNN